MGLAWPPSPVGQQRGLLQLSDVFFPVLCCIASGLNRQSPGRHFTSVNPLPSDSRLTLAEDWKFKGASRSRTRLLPRVKGTCGAGRGRSHSSLSPQHSRAAGTPVPTPHTGTRSLQANLPGSQLKAACPRLHLPKGFPRRLPGWPHVPDAGAGAPPRTSPLVTPQGHRRVAPSGHSSLLSGKYFQHVIL